MEAQNEQLFPSEFILNYRNDDAGKERFLTYCIFQFLSRAGENDSSLPSLLKKKLSCPFTKDSFAVLSDYLTADYYFSPAFTQDTFEPFYLYTAIVLAQDVIAGNTSFFDELLTHYAPVAASLPYTDHTLQLSALLCTGIDFYAALCLCTVHHEATLADLLPRFTEAYQTEFHFTCEDFILFNFMDEYFEQKNCRKHPSFVRLVDTLVAATLNYYDTDFGTLLENEATQSLSGSSSRFAGARRFGSIRISAFGDKDKACHMLAGLFRYAAVYELRNNLFDFHLEDDKLITLDNWQEKLHWHYVQYANVYNLAMDSFHSAILSQTLLKKQFETNLAAL